MKLNGSLVKAAVYGANDGIITTFAVVSGVTGASLDLKVIIILGIANLIADGISMGVSDYLGERAAYDFHSYQGKSVSKQAIWYTGTTTFISFVIAGSVPLLPYFLALLFDVDMARPFLISGVGTGLALFFVGVARTFVTKGSWWRNGLQVLGVGAAAAGVAYLLGDIVSGWLLQQL